MSNWVDKWTVQSETDSSKFYTVSRASDGGFGCSCPAWIFKKMTCKHIMGVAQTIVGLDPTEAGIANRMRFISKMHHIKLSCENCKFYDEFRTSFYLKCKEGHRLDDKQKLLFAKGDKKTFYILGRCCKFYEKA